MKKIKNMSKNTLFGEFVVGGVTEKAINIDRLKYAFINEERPTIKCCDVNKTIKRDENDNNCIGVIIGYELYYENLDVILEELADNVDYGSSLSRSFFWQLLNELIEHGFSVPSMFTFGYNWRKGCNIEARAEEIINSNACGEYVYEEVTYRPSSYITSKLYDKLMMDEDTIVKINSCYCIQMKNYIELLNMANKKGNDSKEKHVSFNYVDTAFGRFLFNENISESELDELIVSNGFDVPDTFSYDTNVDLLLDGVNELCSVILKKEELIAILKKSTIEFHDSLLKKIAKQFIDTNSHNVSMSYKQRYDFCNSNIVKEVYETSSFVKEYDMSIKDVVVALSHIPEYQPLTSVFGCIGEIVNNERIYIYLKSLQIISSRGYRDFVENNKHLKDDSEILRITEIAKNDYKLISSYSDINNDAKNIPNMSDLKTRVIADNGNDFDFDSSLKNNSDEVIEALIKEQYKVKAETETLDNYKNAYEFRRNVLGDISSEEEEFVSSLSCYVIDPNFDNTIFNLLRDDRRMMISLCVNRYGLHSSMLFLGVKNIQPEKTANNKGISLESMITFESDDIDGGRMMDTISDRIPATISPDKINNILEHSRDNREAMYMAYNSKDIDVVNKIIANDDTDGKELTFVCKRLSDLSGARYSLYTNELYLLYAFTVKYDSNEVLKYIRASHLY